MMKLKVTVDSMTYEIDVEVDEKQESGIGPVVIGGGSGPVPAAPATASVQATSSNAVVAPLSGQVARVLVEDGQAITAGEVLVVLEAMKMETEITAPADGEVKQVLVETGEAVSGGQPLVELV